MKRKKSDWEISSSLPIPKRDEYLPKAYLRRANAKKDEETAELGKRLKAVGVSPDAIDKELIRKVKESEDKKRL